MANKPTQGSLSRIIFFSRWLQAPLYLGLIVAQGIYVYHFMLQLWGLVNVDVHGGGHAVNSAEEAIMLGVLGLIDVVMIANLLVMVIVGGYETFVSRLDLQDHPDQPEWLSHVNAGVLKVKLATALIGISSIHLLKSFIDVERRDPKHIFWQVMIHLAFVASAVALAMVEKILAPPANSHGAHPHKA